MIPKIIHMCWFSNDPYPVEIKVCLDSWKRVLPDYRVKIWRMADARALDIPYVNQALDARRWAFAADVVRFYALWAEGGVYMDSDIFLYRRFDQFLPAPGECSTFHEKIYPGHEGFGLQAAFIMGDKGNAFCHDMVEHYRNSSYILPDGTQNNLISPYVMRQQAVKLGYVSEDRELRLPGLTVHPTRHLAPRKRYPIGPDTVGQHRVYGSWRKRKFGRRVEIAAKHWWHVVKYALFRR